MMDDNSRRAQPWEAKQVMYEALISSALQSAERAKSLGMAHEQILLSCKVSGVQDLVAVYRELAKRTDHPLHLGLTEAGMGTKGTVASSVALAILLQEGIGDTIRVSLTPQPGESRTQEVVIASEILQALGLRIFVPSVTACPGCGRTTSTTFQELAMQIDDYLRYQMPVWRKQYPGVENLKVAVMGCIVNGPGESKHADIGIKAAAVHPIRPEALAARQQRRQEFSRGLEGEAVIVQRLVQQAGERDQCEARRRIPARDQRAAETVFTRAVLPAFNPGRRAETQAELAADREHGIHLGIHRAPFVGCKQRAARRFVAGAAETEIHQSGGGGEGAAQCRQANADGGGAADAGAGWHDGIEIQAIDADIASGDRRKPAHVHLVVDADHLAADRAAKGVARLAHGVFV
jgi:hypothetical protein